MKKSIFVYLGFLLLISGCGFHLRGVQELPESIDPVFVQADPRSDLAEEMRTGIRAAGLDVASTPQEAQLIVRLLEETQNDRVLAMDSRGKVIESELIYTARVDVLNNKGETLVEPQQIERRQSQVDAEIEVLGKQQERDLLLDDLRREMAASILRRLYVQLQSKLNLK